MSRDSMDGIYGLSDAPSNCPECGESWSAGERLKTDDEAGIGGYEDWMYCKHCECELFYPVIHRPASSNAALTGSDASAACGRSG